MSYIDEPSQNVESHLGSRSSDSGTSKPTLNDWVRTALAFLVVPTVLIVTIVFWINLTPIDGKDFAGLFTGIVGLIIGFYFGNKGVQQSENRADTAQQHADAMTQKAYDIEAKLKAIRAAADADPDVKAKLNTLL